MNYNPLSTPSARMLFGAVGIYFHDFAMQWQAVPAGMPRARCSRT